MTDDFGTTEESHGRPRMTRKRRSDMGAVPSPDERRRSDHHTDGKFKPGNGAAKGRSAKAAISGRERSALAREISKSVGAAFEPSERGKLLQDVIRLYRHTLNELPAHGAVVLASALAFARESVVASALFSAATEAGIASDRGLQLLEAAQKSEKRSEQASTHAFVISSKLAERPGKIVDSPWFEAPGDESTPEPKP
jgi:hypothetical protein